MFAGGTRKNYGARDKVFECCSGFVYGKCINMFNTDCLECQSRNIISIVLEKQYITLPGLNIEVSSFGAQQKENNIIKSFVTFPLQQDHKSNIHLYQPFQSNLPWKHHTISHEKSCCATDRVCQRGTGEDTVSSHRQLSHQLLSTLTVFLTLAWP